MFGYTTGSWEPAVNFFVPKYGDLKDLYVGRRGAVMYAPFFEWHESTEATCKWVVCGDVS
jgi:hypothetical protein